MKNRTSTMKESSSCCESDCGHHNQNDASQEIFKGQTCGCGSTIHGLNIDFLYLDLSSCQRCLQTESTLEKSIARVKEMLESAGYKVILNKIHVDSIEKAKEYHFLSSPTIRMNGKDIISNLIESNCQDCGELCGNEIVCRDWVFEGVRYQDPPEPMILRAILKEIFQPSLKKQSEHYEVPQNLRKFFDKLTR